MFTKTIQFLKALEKQLLGLNPDHEIKIKYRGGLIEAKKAISEFKWDDGKYPNRHE